MSELTAEIPRLAHSTVRLSGSIDVATAASFLDQFPACVGRSGFDRRRTIQLGGMPKRDDDWPKKSASFVRLMAADMPFLGKIMASFPRDRRWLTRDAMLLIHGRRMMRNVHLEGPLGSCWKKLLPTSTVACGWRTRASPN